MYHIESDVAFTLRDALDSIAILNSKGMHTQCIEIIEKGLLTSQTYGMTNYTILFLTEKRQQLKYYAEAKRNQHANEIREGLVKQAQSIINKEIIKEAHLKSIYWLNTFFPLRDAAIMAEAEELYRQLIAIEGDEFTGHNEINLRNAALSNICAILNRTGEAISYQQLTIVLMEQLDIRKINRVLNYAAAIFNICNLTLSDRDIERSEFWINKLRQIETINEAERLYIESLAIYLEFYLHAIRDPEFNEMMVVGIEEFLLRDHPVPNLFCDTQLLLLNYYMRYDQWQQALVKSNLILNGDYRHSQVLYYVHVRLMNILVHYKLGHLMLLPSLIRSAYRYMRKLNLQYSVENMILKFFNKLLSRSGSAEIREQFAELYTDLETLFADKGERKVMDIYFDYHAWLKKELAL